MKLFVYAHLDERAKDLILARFPEAILVDKQTASAEEQARFADCDVCFGNVRAAWVRSTKALRWLQLESIGFEYYRDSAGEMAAVTVTNLKGMFAELAAETALAGLLALYRGIDTLTLARQEQRWMSLERRERMGLLASRRALVCGLGSIRGRIRDLLVTFGCEVASFTRTAPEADYHSLSELDAALESFDIVVSALPNRPATTGIFDAAWWLSVAPDQQNLAAVC